MTNPDSSNSKATDSTAKRLRKVYIIGLLAIAALAGTKAYITSAMIDRSAFDGKIINIAGRQRMLSQKIAKAALKYEHANTQDAATLAHDELEAAVELWASSHEALRFGSTELGIPGASHPDIVEAYAELQKPFENVRNAAAALLIWEETHTVEDDLEPQVLGAIDAILKHEAVYLPSMHAIVGLHEQAAGERISGLAVAKNVLLAVTLAALIFEAFLVFEPAVKTLSQRLKEILEERRRAEELAKHKADFLANMSHEIRTPMTAILGYADLLLEPELAPQQRAEHIQTIRSNGEHLLGLINDVLDMSKIEAGKLEVERVACAPSQMVEDTMSLMRHKAKQKGLAVQAIVDGPIPANVAADPLRVRQILVNLMGNAIKFTKQGTVMVTSRMTRDEEQHWLEIAVTDTGIGMSPDALARIFEAFGQAETSTTRQFGGTGLGLSISKNLAEAMGGNITVASVEGEGSTFTLRLPAGEDPELSTGAFEGLADTEEGLPDRVEGTPLEGVRIVLAEDGIDNQRLIMHHLKKAGAEVQLVENGKDALETVRDRHEEFDLVLMDVQMPIMDGLVATSSIRQLGIRIPILALTANAMLQDRERCMTAGCDDFLTKPINAPKLINACARWAKRKQQNDAA